MLTVNQHATLDQDGAVIKAEALVVVVLGPTAGAHQVDLGQETAEDLQPAHKRANKLLTASPKTPCWL